MNTKTTTAKASLLATAALLAVPALSMPAQASGSDAVINSAGCATGTIKVKAKADDGKLEVEGEVDTNRVGQTWSWAIRRDGNAVARGTGTTGGASGSFGVERRISNAAGPDRIVFRATRGSTTCSVAVTF